MKSHYGQRYQPKKTEFVTPVTVGEFNFESKRLDGVFRAGIIPYCIKDEIKYFCFGVEDGVGALADFGGQVDPADRNLLDTAVREFTEETAGVFGEIDRDRLNSSTCLMGALTVDILYEVDAKMSSYNLAFENAVKNGDTEVIRFVWLSKTQVLNYIKMSKMRQKGVNMYHMYDKISDLFSTYQQYI